MSDYLIVHAALKAMELRINQGFADVTHNVRREVQNLSLELHQRVTKLEARVETAELGIKRHDSGFRHSSSQDLQHDADIAALIVAVQGTQKNVHDLSQEVKTLRTDTGTATQSQTDALTTTIDSKTSRLDKQGLAGLFLTTAILLLQVILAAAKHLQ